MPRSLALLVCPFRVMRCRLGESKDDGRGLPQVKFILSVLKPLGLPVAIDVMPEQRAVDPFYGIDVTRMHGSLGHLGLLSVRDSTLLRRCEPTTLSISWSRTWACGKDTTSL